MRKKLEKPKKIEKQQNSYKKKLKIREKSRLHWRPNNMQQRITRLNNNFLAKNKKWKKYPKNTWKNLQKINKKIEK